MRTECNPDQLLFAPVEGRAVVASLGVRSPPMPARCYLAPQIAPLISWGALPPASLTRAIPSASSMRLQP